MPDKLSLGIIFLIALIRIILIFIAFIFITTLSTLICLFRLSNTNNVYFTSRYLSKISYLLGVKIEVRIPAQVQQLKSVVYIANHQNSWDIFTISAAVRPHTVSVGKKSLQWIPFFGMMYRATGNILIDRNNTAKAMDTISVTAQNIRDKNMSVWLFPEGTRSNGHGLQPFKTGAFRTAVMADVPIVPICFSNIHEQIKLNRWDNGKIIIEYLPPIHITDTSREGIKELTQSTYDLMLDKIQQISNEVGRPYPPYKKISKQKKKK